MKRRNSLAGHTIRKVKIMKSIKKLEVILYIEIALAFLATALSFITLYTKGIPVNYAQLLGCFSSLGIGFSALIAAKRKKESNN